MDQVECRTLPGFKYTTTEVSLNDIEETGLRPKLTNQVHDLGQITGGKFGCVSNPMFLAVRPDSDSASNFVFNIGMNDAVVSRLVEISGNSEFVYGCYRRFIESYASVVFEIPEEKLLEVYDICRAENSQSNDCSSPILPLTADQLVHLVQGYLALIRSLGFEIPQDPWQQLVTTFKTLSDKCDDPSSTNLSVLVLLTNLDHHSLTIDPITKSYVPVEMSDLAPLGSVPLSRPQCVAPEIQYFVEVLNSFGNPDHGYSLEKIVVVESFADEPKPFASKNLVAEPIQWKKVAKERRTHVIFAGVCISIVLLLLFFMIFFRTNLYQLSGIVTNESIPLFPSCGRV
ncbi:hypothetical protein GEMRC1_008257 [Eukaryota sp. GEM-RC1]